MKIPNVPDYLQEVLQERMKNQFEQLFTIEGEPAMTEKYGQKSVQIYLCKKTGKIYGGESGIYTLGYHDYLTDEERKEIHNWRTRNAEKSRFEKAKKIKWSEWKGDQFFDGEDFFIDIDDFIDAMVAAYGFQYDLWQKYVWATKPEPIIGPKDANDVYWSDMENLSEEYECPVKGEKELQEALDTFVEENSGTTCYRPDYSIAILLDERIEEIRSEDED